MILPGARVRCAYRMAHEGTALDPCDPTAWTGTVAFPETPTREQVEAHVRRCAALGLDLSDKVPSCEISGASTGILNWKQSDSPGETPWKSSLSSSPWPC